MVAAVVAMVSAPGARAQVVDSGALSIMQGEREIGREEFTLERGRRSGSPDGFTLTTTVGYPANSPSRKLSAVVEFLPDSQPAATILEATDGQLQRALMVIAPRRVTVRLKTSTGESAREYPGGGTVLLTCDSLFGHYAMAPRPSGEPVRALTLLGGRRSDAALVDHGVERTTVAGAERSLRHWSIVVAGAERHLWYDERGRLMMIRIPSLGIVVLRLYL
jgi:hypothetical protein